MLYHDLALAIVGLYEQLAAFEIAQRNRVAHALGVVLVYVQVGCNVL